MREQEGYDRAGVPWEDRRAFCSILKAQKHRFEMPVTDLCDRAYVDSREGLSTSPFPSRAQQQPSRRRPAPGVATPFHIADVQTPVADARRLGCTI